MRGVRRSRTRRCRVAERGEATGCIRQSGNASPGIASAGNASWYHPSRPDPSLQPVRALRILWIKARQLHAPVRAVDELELTHVHPHVGHARSGTGGEQEDISRAEGVDEGRDLGSRARLIAAHARQPNAVLAVCVLNQSRAVESVVGRPAPDVRRKSTRLNSSHSQISYAVFCLKKKKLSKDFIAADYARS